jgi:hypothetical protein
MQTLELTHWELCELTSVYHELFNEREQLCTNIAEVCRNPQLNKISWIENSHVSKIMWNRTKGLFDKVRMAEFAERNKPLTPMGK